MNMRKLLFVMVVSAALLCSVGGVSSALFLDFLDDATAEPDTPIELEGLNFTLPAGYKEDTINNTTDENGITTVDYIYGNDEGYMIDISILYNGRAEDLELIDSEHSPKTIGDKDGQMSSGKSFCNFVYVDGDRLVSIVARNESIVQKLITGE